MTLTTKNNVDITNLLLGLGATILKKFEFYRQPAVPGQQETTHYQYKVTGTQTQLMAAYALTV